MEKQEDKVAEGGEIQVFELTMDNPEDQDALNRQLRKPGEASRCTAEQAGDAAQEGRTK
jgi:hypothetical protein